jgi:CheY-like chemotaxis protein
MLAAAAHPSQTAPSAAVAQVLVVEDEYLIAAMIAEQLEELGYGVVGPAFSMAEARRLAQSAPIDCALLDWDLAGCATGDIADILSARHIPFVFASGYGQAPDPARRGDPVLKKPFAFDDLRRAVESALRHG